MEAAVLAEDERDTRSTFPNELVEDLLKLSLSAAKGDEELQSDIITRAYQAFAAGGASRWDRAKGAFSTWVYQIAWRCRQDRLRRPENDPTENDLENIFENALEADAEMVKLRPGNPGFTEDQKRALAKIASDYQLTTLGVVRFLRRRPDVRKTLGFRRVPSQPAVWRAIEWARENP